ncbi:MAG: DUF3380 domain-containing protein [Anaerolineae bacterium]|nr:DUF3380 domain-containing protein [Anaerolineae bacterium]
MPRYGVVTVDRLNFREAANTAARIITVLTRGTILEILRDSDSEWVQARVDGTTTVGYVSKTYLRLSDTKPDAANPAPTPSPSPSVPPAPTVPPSTPAPSGRAEVTATSLNIRSGPGTNYDIVMPVSEGTVLNVIENQGDWVKVRVGVGEGYVAAKYVNLNTRKAATSFLIEQGELLSASLPPARQTGTIGLNSSELMVARIWNSYGGLLGKLAAKLSVPVNAAVAVLAAESGGNAFDPSGRLIIRFENHIFYQYWGAAHRDVFNRYFTFDASSPANGWRGHLWRPDENSGWLPFHGNQDAEWRVLTLARALDDTAALSSISMGAPQVMGFNFKRLGYDKVQTMFYQFARSANAQILGLFDFVRGMDAASPAIRALQRRDYRTFASIYNGPGNAATYSDIIQRYVAAYNRIIG